MVSFVFYQSTLTVKSTVLCVGMTVYGGLVISGRSLIRKGKEVSAFLSGKARFDAAGRSPAKNLPTYCYFLIKMLVKVDNYPVNRFQDSGNNPENAHARSIVVRCASGCFSLESRYLQP